MPELPEVESLRRSLLPYLQGKQIRSVLVHKPKLVSAKGTVRVENPKKVQEFVHVLVGQRVATIIRKAKNLIIHLSSGNVLLVHLKMTGQLVWKSDQGAYVLGGHPIELSEQQLPNKHSHIIFEFEDGTLYYNDVRMFGYILLYESLQRVELEGHFDKLGLDPISSEFTYEYFLQHLKKKSGCLKTVLMNQTVVTGLGNIYVDEVCFRAKIKPQRQVSSLKIIEIRALYDSIRIIIPKAIDLGGSSVANYILADGQRGTYAREHMVYNRAGKPCLVCQHTLQKAKVNNRTTVWCDFCQG